MLRESRGIENCIIYKNETTCLVCAYSFVLSIDKKECLRNDYELQYIDPDCEDQIMVTPHYCGACM